MPPNKLILAILKQGTDFDTSLHCTKAPKTIKIKFQTVCRGLPESWKRVITDKEFPVDTGTLVAMSCQEGYINTGSKGVTCNTELYQDFEYGSVPSCSNISKNDTTLLKFSPIFQLRPLICIGILVRLMESYNRKTTLVSITVLFVVLQSLCRKLTISTE